MTLSKSTLRDAALALWLATALGSASTELAAQPAASAEPRASDSRELLNSERIERRYGNYGVEVIDSDATTRVSNLYSEHAGQRICRTFAVVRYAPRIDPRLAEEHAAILAGGSIGATFSGRGWAVEKANRYAGEIATTPRLAALMSTGDGARLAVHVYALAVAKNGTRIEYATIAEIHHPDYLGLAEIQEIYGGGGTLPTEPDATTRELLAIVANPARAARADR